MTAGQGQSESERVTHIYVGFSRNRKEARDRYREEFGRKIDDPSIDEELQGIFADAVIEGKDIVSVPVGLALALVLRPRGRGRRRPPKERRAVRAEGLAIGFANERWAELVADSRPSKQAKHTAAQQAHKQFGRTARVGVETIKSRMRLKKRKGTPASR
jgi:hypothetical protein